MLQALRAIGTSLSVVYLNPWVQPDIGSIKHLMAFVLFGLVIAVNSVQVLVPSNQALVLQILLITIVHMPHISELQQWKNSSV